MISSGYLELVQRNHRETAGKGWGFGAARNFGEEVLALLHRKRKIKTILDFGAGQCSLERYCNTGTWTNYDPGVPGIEVLPEARFDLIVTADVLEHVEPEHFDETLSWIHRHSKRYHYHRISCDPCLTTLPDGRNAHLIVESPEWWKKQFTDRGMNIIRFAHEERESPRHGTRTYAVILVEV
jgi:hypothetical protein